MWAILEWWFARIFELLFSFSFINFLFVTKHIDQLTAHVYSTSYRRFCRWLWTLAILALERAWCFRVGQWSGTCIQQIQGTLNVQVFKGRGDIIGGRNKVEYRFSVL